MLAVAAWLSPLDRDQYGGSYPQATSTDTQESRQHAAPKHQVSDERPSFSDFIISWLTYLQNAPDSAKDAQSNSENTRQDLQAQKAMALWTFWMFLASGFSVLVAIFTVILVYLTLRETRETTKAAIGALRAERAWMCADVATRKSVQDKIVAGAKAQVVDGIVVWCSWRNVGKSPALRFNSWTKLELVPWDAPPFRFAKSPQPIADTPPIGPALPTATPRLFVSIKDAIDICNRQKEIHYWMRCEYNDIFDSNRRHFTEVCVRMRTHSAPHGLIMPQVADTYFFSEIYGPQNGSD